MRKLFFTMVVGTSIVSLIFTVLPTLAQSAFKKQVLWESPLRGPCFYRTPVIVRTADGSLLVVTDCRETRGDLGYKLESGHGIIHLASCISRDNGMSWSMPKLIAVGRIGKPDANGNDFNRAHGDAALVADRESGKVLLLAGSGIIGTGMSTRDNPILVGKSVSNDNGQTWSEWENVTSDIYSVVHPEINALFFTSGHLCQSSQIKVGKYYRIYASLCCFHKGATCSVAIYSDDFGDSWKTLGDSMEIRNYTAGEAKLVELPDGSILMSANHGQGRYFNIFRYTDYTSGEGSWESGTIAFKEPKAFSSNSDLIITPAIRNNEKIFLAFQSLTFGKRDHVSIYYKELESPADFDSVSDFSEGWKLGKQVSDTTSNITSMTISNGMLSFVWEENIKTTWIDTKTYPYQYWESWSGYDMMFQNYFLSTLTGGVYDHTTFSDEELRNFLGKNKSAEKTIKVSSVRRKKLQ